MNAKPKTGKAPIYTEDGVTVVLECEIVQPQSSAGRTVYVFFDPKTVTETLLIMRDAAIYARNKSEGESRS